jgi:membrane protein implicated in regulation of membrane protease activity
MPSDSDRHPYVIAGLVVVIVALLAYSLLIIQQILLGVLAVGVVLLLYLLWRFVRSNEPHDGDE